VGYTFATVFGTSSINSCALASDPIVIPFQNDILFPFVPRKRNAFAEDLNAICSFKI
jgi:hypothetical protein